MVSIAGTRRMAPGNAEQRQALAPRYVAVRRATEELCRPLATEDYGLQAMADASRMRRGPPRVYRSLTVPRERVNPGLHLGRLAAHLCRVNRERAL